MVPVNVQANPGITFEAAQVGLRDIAAARRKARESLTDALNRRANANHGVAKGMAVAFAKYRAKGEPVEAAKIYAKADAADKQLEADMADTDVRTAQARLAELEGERSSLRMLADWTREESA